MTRTRPTHRAPVRQRRSLRNDAAILDAAVRMAADVGWAGLTPGHIAEVSGLTRPTVLQRHADRSALGAAIWRSRLAEPLLHALTSLVAVADARPITASDLRAGLGLFVEPDETMRAASELLLVAGYDSSLNRAVAETLGPSFTQWFTPQRNRVTRSQAARNAFVVSMALGFVLEARRYGTFDVDFTETFDRFAHALNAPSSPARLPSARADYLDAPISFDTGEPAWDAALTATLHCVRDLGYEAATIEAITAESGYSRTVIFSRYSSKQELFFDATERMLASNVETCVAYPRRIEASIRPG